MASAGQRFAGSSCHTIMLDTFLQDLRYAVRGLRAKPAFTAAVVVTLGLGLGANATMFGIVDRLLFRPPAFLAAPERTVRVLFGTTDDGKEDIDTQTSYHAYADLRRWTRCFDAAKPFYTSVVAV